MVLLVTLNSDKPQKKKLQRPNRSNGRFGETLQSEQLEGCHRYEEETVLCNHGNRLRLENSKKKKKNILGRGNIFHCSS